MIRIQSKFNLKLILLKLELKNNLFFDFFRDLRDVENERREKYGSVFGIYMGTIPFLVVSDPEFCKIVTIKEAKNFTDTNTFKSNQRFFRDSFINKKGQEWKDGRNLVSPCFTARKIKEIYPQIQKAANPLLVFVYFIKKIDF